MKVRRLIALSLFALLAPLGATACSSEGAGSKTECQISGCTVTFDRGVNAKASVLGIDAELVAVNGNTVTLKVGGQQVDVPVGDTQPTDGFNVTVQEVTADKVVVKIATGITTNN
ncbi:hypothetical protein [Nocardia sp. XZ_19_385]|uniref:hypothetical protein n=1 Tax=Nocardia sp. XZ_19_385 TaxID=2769488 RepID=UPI00188FA09D|nr:hypothetical protein [Nocardia sp. XZ_19_385]